MTCTSSVLYFVYCTIPTDGGEKKVLKGIFSNNIKARHFRKEWNKTHKWRLCEIVPTRAKGDLKGIYIVLS